MSTFHITNLVSVSIAFRFLGVEPEAEIHNIITQISPAFSHYLISLRLFVCISSCLSGHWKSP